MAAAMISCSSAVLGIEKFTGAYARKVYEQMVALIQSRNLELHHQNFQNLSIQWKQIFYLSAEHNCSGENAWNMHVSWMMLQKQGA